MLGTILAYSGATIILVWGIAHFFPTRTIVRSFGPISDDNIKIITMEWLAEGVALCFMGALCILITAFAGRAGMAPVIVYLSTSAALVVLAVMGWFTYARTPVIPMKLCPWIQTLSAALLAAGALV